MQYPLQLGLCAPLDDPRPATFFIFDYRCFPAHIYADLDRKLDHLWRELQNLHNGLGRGSDRSRKQAGTPTHDDRALEKSWLLFKLPALVSGARIFEARALLSHIMSVPS